MNFNDRILFEGAAQIFAIQRKMEMECNGRDEVANRGVNIFTVAQKDG